jgi:type VI secretion system secreted protein Hcp
MEYAGYMTIEGVVQGNIEGSSLAKGRENKISVFSLNHELKLPFQSQQNIGNGPVVHQPLAIVKEIDRSTPKLYQALVEKECLSKVVLEWYRYTATGEELVYYRIELTNAHVISISPCTPNIQDSSKEYLRFMENLSFAYEGISWSWGPDGDVTYQTNWRGD